jgi:hypothetical protein
MLRGKCQDGCHSFAVVIGWHKRSMNLQEILIYILLYSVCHLLPR